MSKRILVILILLALVGGGGYAWHQRRQHAGQPGPLILYGNVDIRTAQLAFDGEALVASMRVEEGTQVKAGDVLATLDTSRLRVELAVAKAQTAALTAAVRRLEAGTRKPEIEQVRARVASVEARLANAEQNEKRLKQTVATGASSQQRLDDAQALVRIEQAALTEAKQALALAIEGPRREDLEEAKAHLAASAAQIALLEDRLADAELRAPRAGTIQSRLLEPGEYAGRGRAAYVLAQTDPKWIRAYVPEPSLGRVRPGARAWVTTDSFPGQGLDGWVGYISPVAEFTPKAVETSDLRTQLVFEVRVYVHDPTDRLRLGMPATVTIDETSPPVSVTSPATPSEAAGKDLP